MAIFARGTILIPGADFAGPEFESAEVATLISTVDGATVGTLPSLPTAECGDNLPSGIYALMGQDTPAGRAKRVRVYSPDDTLIASVTLPTPPTNCSTWSPLRRAGANTFFFLRIDINGPGAGGDRGRLSTIDDAGTLGGTTIQMPVSANGGATALAAQHDLSMVYFGMRSGPSADGARFSTGVGRMTWPAGVEQTALIPTSAGLAIQRDLLVTVDGHILVCVFTGGTFAVRRYQDDGTLLATYTLEPEAQDGDSIELSYDPSDDTVFWVRTYPGLTPDNTSRFRKLRISDGSVLTDFEIVTIQDEGNGTTLVPVSCPFLIAPGIDESTRSVIGPLVWAPMSRRLP